jgi:hypothetical protein
MKISATSLLVMLITAPAVMRPSAVLADAPCAGHEMLSTPRDEASCDSSVKPQAFPSPDAAVRAFVFPVGIDLNATPDMESRVAFRGQDGKLLNSRSFASARGTNGYYVVNAQWSPDSQFFVFSLSSSGGHSPWSFPMWVFSRETSAFAEFSQMIGKNPTLSPDFKFTGPHTVMAATWDKEGSQTQRPVTVDLAAGMKKAGPAPAACEAAP